MNRVRRLTGLIVCACLILAVPAWASDAVVAWNDIGLQAINQAITAGRPGLIAFLDLATVHAAVYDAVQAIEKRHEPYHVEIPGAKGSPAAAAAKAAHDVLLNRLPAQAAFLETSYHDFFAANGLSENDPGVEVGKKAAEGIIALRANDGSFPPNPPPFIGGTDPGVWRPTQSYLPGPPPSFAPMAVPWLGAVDPFTLTGGSRYRAKPMPGLTSSQYTKDYNEVKAKGAFFNSTRTPAQTDLAYFWADNFANLWNRGLRAIADAHIHKIADSARLFALTSFAIADAAITAWDSKRHYAFWRPVTAVQEGNNDGNPNTAGDPSWQSLINNPNYPDYTSGANNVTGAVTRILELFFGKDRMTFSLTSAHPLVIQNKRSYKRFSQAADEVVDARVFLGIHFRFADTEARKQGERVAEWAFNHFLWPVDHGNDHDDDDDDDDDVDHQGK